MSSSLAWMDHSEAERKRMLNVVALFRFRDTRDELGLGSIRDAFSDLLFPGTSTIQTRPRYFLLVPWVMLRLERERVRSSNAAERARRLEGDIIDALMRGGADSGVLGKEAGRNLQRLPSAVYWGGLGSYRIRRFSGSIGDYFRSLDGLYVRQQATRVRAEGDELYERVEHTWDPNLPTEPEGLWDTTTLELRFPEAEYLKERILISHPDSLLAHLLQVAPRSDRAKTPWDLTVSLPPDLREVVHHARLVSEVMQGAALLYNLELARSADELGLAGHRGRIDRYVRDLGEWSARLVPLLDEVAAWDRPRLWGLVASAGYRTTPHTQGFVEAWTGLVLSLEGRVADDLDAIALITRREHQVKRRLARLGSRARLEKWTGESGTSPLTYRWQTAKTILTDIREGLARA